MAYWEHWELLDNEKYQNHIDAKKNGYEKHYAGRLVEILESTNLSANADAVIKRHLS